MVLGRRLVNVFVKVPLTTATCSVVPYCVLVPYSNPLSVIVRLPLSTVAFNVMPVLEIPVGEVVVTRGV